jgi:hypothetical protein
MNNTKMPDLSPRDLNLIKTLRRHEKRWPRTRWLVLGLGLLASLGSVLFGRLLWSGLAPVDGGRTAAAVALFSFLGISLAWTAVFCFSIMFPGHRLHTERSLLLKLADAQGLTTEP